MLVTLSGDLREELPVLFLRLREAVVGGDTQLVEIAPTPTALSALAAASLRIRPGEAPLVAQALTGDDAAATASAPTPRARASTPARSRRPGRCWPAIPRATGVVIVAGRPSYAESGEVVAEAVRAAGRRAAQGEFLPALRRGNVFGAIDMGLAPGLLPGPGQPRCGPGALHRRLGRGPAAPGSRRPSILASMAGEADGRRRPAPSRALVLLGSDPLERLPRPRRRRGRRCRPGTSSSP